MKKTMEVRQNIDSSEEQNSGADCCTSSGYSCEDDPNLGPFKKATVDLLYLDLTVCDRCTGTDARTVVAVERCRPLLAACGFQLALNMIHIADERLAEYYRFYSSPTIRVNGVDICPLVEENDCDCCKTISDSDVQCRLFQFNGVYYEIPPTDMIIKSILEIVLQGKTPDNEVKPYVLPENLKSFFKGKRTKKSCC